MQQLLRLVRKPNASRSARNNNGPLGQRRALRKEADNLLDREDKVPKSRQCQLASGSREGKKERNARQPTILHNLPILQPAQPELPDIGHEALGDEDGANGAGAVEALGVAPLGLGELGGPARDVVAGRVPQHVVEGVGLRHVLSLAPEHDRQLGLVVGRVAGDRVLGNDGRRRVGVGEAGRGFAVRWGKRG